MLQKLQKRNKTEGFTIIEVLIVLAIAGLILLIVFLAVPALQRNTRNTQRKSDAGRIGSAINNFVSNNQGSLPQTTTDLTTVMNDAGKLGQYPSAVSIVSTSPITYSLSADTSSTATAGTNDFDVEYPGVPFTGSGPTVNGNAEILDDGYACGGAAGSTSNGTAKQAALFYSLELSKGNYAWSCLDVQ